MTIGKELNERHAASGQPEIEWPAFTTTKVEL